MYANPKKPLFWLGAVAAAAAFFASGALVARATIDEDDEPAGQAQQIVVPGVAGGARPANVPASLSETDDGKTTANRGGADMSFPACRTPLPAGLISNGSIDWSKANFAPALPTSGFSALNFSVATQANCKADGSAGDGALVLSSGWVHDETQLEVYISQVASSERVAPVLHEGSATFWANGYLFRIGVNAYHILPVAEDAGATAPAPPSASGSGSAGAPAPDRIAPPAGPDPRAKEVLAQLIGQLSPSTEMKCFWTVVPGDWDTLSASGIGDPRAAIPSGFTLTDMHATAFQAPAAGCDTSLKPVEGLSFNANWQKDSGQAYIGVSVYSTGGGVEYPGSISDYGANWTRNGLQFGVYGKAEDALGVETIRAIAKALDPQFNEACFVQERKLADADLAALGFSPAKAPAGYSLQGSRLVASEIAAGCPKPEGFQPSYALSWTFAKGADVIEAGANRYGDSTSGDGSGYQGPNHFSWTSANGTNFYVNAYSRGVNPEVSKDDLIAVAKSMDPGFDISKLVEGGDAKPLAADAAAAQERSAR